MQSLGNVFFKGEKDKVFLEKVPSKRSGEFKKTFEEYRFQEYLPWTKFYTQVLNLQAS